MLILFIQVLIGYLFLSTGISKIIRPSEHLSRIYEYNIITSGYLARTFLLLTAFCETTFSLLLIFKTYELLSSAVLLILILIYSVAILINLYKGNTINCGCGGFIGDSTLSRMTVIRNVVLTILVTYILFNNRNENINTELDAQSTLMVYTFTFLGFVLYTMYKKINMLNNEYTRVLTR